MTTQRENYMRFRRALADGPLHTGPLAERIGVSIRQVNACARTLLRDGDVRKKDVGDPQVLWWWTGK